MAAQSSTCWFQPASARGVGSIVSKPSARRVVKAVDDPVHVLLDRHRHVGQHRRAPGTGNGEEVGKADGSEAEVGRRTVCPLLLQGDAVSPDDVDRDEGSGHGVEAGGVDDGIEGEGLVHGVDPRLGDGGDRVPAQVDQPDMGKVVGLEVVGVETRAAWCQTGGRAGRAPRRSRGRRPPRGSSRGSSRPRSRWTAGLTSGR